MFYCFRYLARTLALNNLNGIPLGQALHDDTYFSEPRLAWKIIGEKENNLRQTKYAISLDGAHIPLL